MPNKMLIDASHPEETRVVVVRGNRIEEFDFESQDKKQLKGNIYLARVTRVEPSLQAAFVEYGGNRHGFLAFSEIHPDYYQIPVADRQALLRAEAEAHEDEEDDEESDGEGRQERGGRGRRRRRGRNRDRNGAESRAASTGESADSEVGEADDDLSVAPFEDTESGELRSADSDEVAASASDEAVIADESSKTGDSHDAEDDGDASGSGATSSEDDEDAPKGGSMAAAIDADVISEPVAEKDATAEDSASDEDREGDKASPSEGDGEHGDNGGSTAVEDVPGGASESEVESVGAEDALEEIRERRRPMRRHYKIQEVIKRRQILLVQVVKEERGNKGAALTTYLSLAGRYSVLMPNTARGGGISRKITNAQDRKRLKDVVKDLDVPEGMGVILRTAGESRTKAEIKRDYEYLMRMWETVRTTTLQSTAPALVYEEGSLIKRSVRDLYNKDIDEILVAGDDGYREAKDFMRMLMPSHAKVVQPYRDTTPIFARSGLEAQLDRMLQPQVTLKSGGYIIINQTEALVSIDVNSGRSTREHSIEDTALQTNLEAAEEVARQLRLRDLAGLIVIDFIDMEENRNNRAVEKKLKDCLKNDRARIQVGRISHFGLLEMSRQRIRASVLESTMKPCPHCGGTGHVRSDSSVALHVVRAIEEFLLKDSRHHISVKTPTATALYVLNHKRSKLNELEARFGVTITIEADETVGIQHYQIFRGAVAEKPADFVPAVMAPPPVEEPEDIDIEPIEDEDDAGETVAERPQRRDNGDSEEGGHRKKRRRRRRGGRDRDQRDDNGPAQAKEHPESEVSADAEDQEDGDSEGAESTSSDEAPAGENGDRKKRRRGKRGGRRNRGRDEENGDQAEVSASDDSDDADDSNSPDEHDAEAQSPSPDDEGVSEEPASVREIVAATVTEVVSEPAEAEPQPRVSRRRATEDAPSEPVVSSSGEAEAVKPKKGGWWQRKGFF